VLGNCIFLKEELKYNNLEWQKMCECLVIDGYSVLINYSVVPEMSGAFNTIYFVGHMLVCSKI
jgi:hypothetical protein